MLGAAEIFAYLDLQLLSTEIILRGGGCTFNRVCQKNAPKSNLTYFLYHFVKGYNNTDKYNYMTIITPGSLERTFDPGFGDFNRIFHTITMSWWRYLKKTCLLNKHNYIWLREKSVEL